jgi:hypothetical protein
MQYHSCKVTIWHRQRSKNCSDMNVLSQEHNRKLPLVTMNYNVPGFYSHIIDVEYEADQQGAPYCLGDQLNY